MKLIVGLGNPGKEYTNTRHNIGFMALDNYLKNPDWKENSYAYYINLKTNKDSILFIKPKTYMNLSGNAVSYFVNYYKIDKNNILVIQDDLDLELGKIKLKYNSSSGGHNGIKSLIENLHTQEFLRLKVGISKPENNIINYVLDKFSKTELDTLNNSQEIINNILNDFIDGTANDKLMNKYN